MRNRLLNLYARNARKGQPLAADSNTILIYDFIAGSESEAEWWGGVSAEGFRRQLAAIEGDLTVRIDSPGGDVFGGRAIAQAIREHAGKVTCQIDGLAASAASYIAIAGDTVVAAPGSFMMIHRAWTLALGNCVDMRAQADVLEKIDASIARSYAAKAGGEEAEWLDRMQAETWLVAEEAAELGLIDAVLPESSAKARAWDLSAFAQAPAAAVREPEPTPDPDNEQDAVAEAAAIQNGIERRQRKLTVDLLIQTA